MLSVGVMKIVFIARIVNIYVEQGSLHAGNGVLVFKENWLKTEEKSFQWFRQLFSY